MREVKRVKYQQYELPDYLFFASAKAKKQKTGTERFDPNLAAGGREAFTSSTSPASGLNKKTIILDSNGCIDLTFSERIAFAKKLMQLGFEVYLCSQNEPFGYAKLTEDLANYQILDQLTKFNYKGGYQNLANHFQLARDTVKVLNPVDLYEVKTSFTEFFQDASDQYFIGDSLKANVMGLQDTRKAEKYINDMLEILFNNSYYYAVEQKKLEFISEFVNTCISTEFNEVILIKLLIRKLEKIGLDDKNENEKEIKRLILRVIEQKSGEYQSKILAILDNINVSDIDEFEELVSSKKFMNTELSILLHNLFKFDLEGLKSLFKSLILENKFNRTLILSELRYNNKIATLFLECLIDYYPDVNELPENFQILCFNPRILEIFETVNYEYSKKLYRFNLDKSIKRGNFKSDQLKKYLKKFPDDQDWIIEKLRSQYNAPLEITSQLELIKFMVLENFYMSHDNHYDFFLKLQEFIDEDYCRGYFNRPQKTEDFIEICMVMIKIWPNIIDEKVLSYIKKHIVISESNFHDHLASEVIIGDVPKRVKIFKGDEIIENQYLLLSIIFDVRPDLVANILEDEYFLNLKFDETKSYHLRLLKSAFKSDPEATRKFIEKRTASDNMPLTPLTAIIFPENAESILDGPLIYRKPKAIGMYTEHYARMEKDINEKIVFDIFEKNYILNHQHHPLRYLLNNSRSRNIQVLRNGEFSYSGSDKLVTEYLLTKRPTSICFQYMDCEFLNELQERYPKDFFNDIVTIELYDIKNTQVLGKFYSIFPNLKHISVSANLAKKLHAEKPNSDNLELKRYLIYDPTSDEVKNWKKDQIIIEVDQLSLLYSQNHRKSDGLPELKFQQNGPKPSEIFLGFARKNYELDSSNETQSNLMHLSGKVLNNDFRGTPYIITSVKTMTISDRIDFEVVSANEFESIVIPNVTSEKIAEFASSKSSSKLYASLNISLRRGEPKFLPCLSSFDEFEGIIGDVPKGVKIFKGNDGFYYAESDRVIDFNYIVSSDQTRKVALSNGDAKKIIEDFQHKQDDYKEIKAEIPKNAEGIKAWLDNLYDKKLGACRHRVAAVYYKLLEAGISEDNIRGYGINGNHIIIAVKEGDKWVSYDLGGKESKLIFLREKPSKSTSYTTQKSKYRNLKQLKNDVKANFEIKLSLNESTVEDLFAKVGNSLDLCKGPVFGSFIGRKTFLNSKTLESLKKLDQVKAQEILDKFNQNFEDKQQQSYSSLGGSQLSSKPQPRESLTEAQVLNRKLLQDFQTKFSFKTLEQDVFEGLLANEASKILIATNRIDEHANYLIRQYGDRVFYIDNPDQLDFTRSRLQIARNGSVSLTQESDLERFLRSPELGNGALVINWSSFSNQQKVALNTLLDREATIADINLPADLKIISLDKAKSEDPSFASRHNISFKSSLNPQVRDYDRADGVPKQNSYKSSVQLATTIEIDLMGLSDWRQALFGKISLAGAAIIWHRSDFVDKVRKGSSNFEISNLSEQAVKELNYEVRQAKAKGYFDYHGYRIKLPDGFDVKVTAKNFDFSKFNAISVRQDCQYDQESGAVIINTHIFDKLLHSHKINFFGYYNELVGLIEQKKGSLLQIFITSELTEAQYYCMLNESVKHDVQLEILLAPGIKIPQEIRSKEIVTSELEEKKTCFPNDFNPFKVNLKKALAKIIVTNDIGLYKVQRDEQVIDIEDFGFEALIRSISFKTNETGFSNFSEKFTQFKIMLERGRKFVLRGEFSNEILNILAPLIANQGENLTIVIEDKDLKEGVISYPRLNWLSNRLEFRYEELESQQEVTKRTEIEDKSFDLEYSEANAVRFIETRKGLVLGSFEESNMVLLEGHSGVGKSSLMKEFEEHHQDQISVHRELTSFAKWAEDQSKGKTKILFIDESNIEDKHFTLFNGLKSDGARSIFYNGKFYDLTKDHKVVFACNPIEYGGGRFDQKLFNQGDIPIIEFRDFPASYIYENILKRAIYCERMMSRLDESRFKEICAPLIEQYKKQQEVSGDTVRELQEQVLRELLQEFKQEFKVAPASDLKGSNFITTSATKKVEQELYEAINIRAKQRSGVFNGVASGLNGVLLEGGAGVGKSEMIKEMLRDNNIGRNRNSGDHCYYKIEADMPLADKRKLIVKAFEEGNIVWIDEINSCLDDGLEKILNSVLTGIHPDTGERSAKAGFMLLASCNSAGLEGRSIISPALRHRMSTPQLTELVDYEIEDLKQIIQHWYRNDGIDEVKALQLATSFKEMISNPEYTECNLRMLRDVLVSKYGLTSERDREEEIFYKEKSKDELNGTLGNSFEEKVRAEQVDFELK